MKYILLLVVAMSLIISGCKKEQNRQLLNAYFNFKANGVQANIIDGIVANDNTFDCILQGDSVLYIDVTKLSQGAGFVIKGHPIKDTTYILDSMQRAYYTDPGEKRRIYTTRIYKGVLTIKKGTFQAKDILKTLEGSFSYQVKDTVNSVVHDIVNGSFLMERKDE